MKWGKKYEENEVISEDILIYIYNDAFDFNYSALADFPNCAIPKCTCYEYGSNKYRGKCSVRSRYAPAHYSNHVENISDFYILLRHYIGIVFILFSRGITTPILSLSKSANQMSKLKTDAKAAVLSTDEIGALATDINNLYQSLLLTIRNLELEKEKVSLAEKEKIDFLRTASHELKTPVTELNATLENMILGIGKYRDYETYLPKCKEITEQLGDMIRDILNASRLQTQGNNEPCSNFSLRSLLTELCEPYRLIAEAKGVKFKIELSSDAFVYLPEGQLKKAISNILSNAVNYTEAGQSILVVFDKNKLSVSNECSVLPPEQLQHIFEPFYRPDLAHSQATGGNGLGLYIVQKILDKLRLKYQFVPMPNDRGMSFTIQF